MVLSKSNNSQYLAVMSVYSREPTPRLLNQPWVNRLTPAIQICNPSINVRFSNGPWFIMVIIHTPNISTLNRAAPDNRQSRDRPIVPIVLVSGWSILYPPSSFSAKIILVSRCRYVTKLGLMYAETFYRSCATKTGFVCAMYYNIPFCPFIIWPGRIYLIQIHHCVTSQCWRYLGHSIVCRYSCEDMLAFLWSIVKWHWIYPFRLWYSSSFI